MKYTVHHMKKGCRYIALAIWGMSILSACSTLEKASTHGLNSGYYQLKAGNEKARNVYLDVSNERIDVYPQEKRQPDQQQFLTIDFNPTDSIPMNPLVLRKQSLDIDITSILLKYRPSVYGLPAQLTTDLNLALYAGWRHDYYRVTTQKDPLGRSYRKMNSRGFDVGVFAGPGAIPITPFTTRNIRTDEYSGMIIQAGMAGFLESNVASFGFAIGYDHLLNPDRKIWIYQRKPWLGFVVGIALN